MIEINGKEYRTELQWERVHRHLGKRAKEGVTREWMTPRGRDSAVFYPRSQTRAWTKAEIRREREAKKAAKLEAEIKRRVDSAVEEAERRLLASVALKASRAPEEALARHGGDGLDWLTSPHTAYQWVESGFVPLEDAVWRRDGAAEGYWYCRCWDVRFDQVKASGLMEGAPREVDRLPDGRPYDGRPWW